MADYPQRNSVKDCAACGSSAAPISKKSESALVPVAPPNPKSKQKREELPLAPKIPRRFSQDLRPKTALPPIPNCQLPTAESPNAFRALCLTKLDALFRILQHQLHCLPP